MDTDHSQNKENLNILEECSIKICIYICYIFSLSLLSSFRNSTEFKDLFSLRIDVDVNFNN